MRTKLLLIVIISAATFFTAKAQDAVVPDYKLAGQLQMIIRKIGLPVDSASIYLDDFEKMPSTRPSESVFRSKSDDHSYIIFKTGDHDQIILISVSMPATMLSTAQKFIYMMGMRASGTAAPPGYTAYATPKYAAFLNPEIKPGVLALALLQGGN